MPGKHCASSCRTRDHDSWGHCVRSQNQKVGWAKSAAGLDLSKEKKFQNDLAAYRSAVSQGIEPKTTMRRDTDAAVQISDKTGQAFNGLNL